MMSDIKIIVENIRYDIEIQNRKYNMVIELINPLTGFPYTFDYPLG